MDKMYGNVPVIIHADDYGETYNTSLEMLKLMKGGHLDGISLITNMRDAKRYFDMFYKAIPDMPYLPLINVHINLVEGRSLLVEGPEDSVYDTPCLAWDWGGLFKASYHIPARDRNGEPMRHVKEITLQLKTGKAFIEKAQSIAEEKGVPYTPQEIRIDSHQHAHMIPIVRKAIAGTMYMNESFLNLFVFTAACFLQNENFRQEALVLLCHDKTINNFINCCKNQRPLSLLNLLSASLSAVIGSALFVRTSCTG